jgi:hypothetical protein
MIRSLHLLPLLAVVAFVPPFRAVPQGSLPDMRRLRGHLRSQSFITGLTPLPCFSKQKACLSRLAIHETHYRLVACEYRTAATNAANGFARARDRA